MQFSKVYSLRSRLCYSIALSHFLPAEWKQKWRDVLISFVLEKPNVLCIRIDFHRPYKTYRIHVYILLYHCYKYHAVFAATHFTLYDEHFDIASMHFHNVKKWIL